MTRRRTTDKKRGAPRNARRDRSTERPAPVQKPEALLRGLGGYSVPTSVRRWGGLAARWLVRVGLATGIAYAGLIGVRKGYNYATTSPRFEVRGLIYTPTLHVDDARLRELMALEPGTNILSLELEALAQQIAADPWVAKATLTRVLPDSLKVSVQEHEAAAVVLASDFLLVNAEGIPFKRLEPEERQQRPIITVGSAAQDPQVAAPRIRRGLDVLAAYQAKHRPRLSEVAVADDDTVTLYTAERGSQLRLGRGDPGPALARYDALRAALGQDSDKLAVAHLDGSAVPDGKDRVVASFFETEAAPGFVVEASQEVLEGSEAQSTQPEESHPTSSRAKQRARLPRYE